MKRGGKTGATALLAAAAIALAVSYASAPPPLGGARGGDSGTPWVRYVMVGLWGFRGAISEVLWVRAARLQEQGRFIELVRLSEWINALDPRATDAWAFSAWNLAYNVAAMVSSPKARLQWVESGVSLLRDKAIPANPRAPSLFRELGWLYQNKIGASDDSANITYKLALAATQEAIDAGRDAPSRIILPPDQKTVGEIEARFGPLDWRLAQAHSIYWAWQGFAMAKDGFDKIALRRMIQQNLVSLIMAGKFTGDATTGVWKTEPNFALVAPTMAFFEEAAFNSVGETRVYRIFLEVLLQRLDAAGETDLAAKVRERLDELPDDPEMGRQDEEP